MKQAATFLSLMACASLLAAYGVRPDWATALTIFPAGVWLVFSLPAVFAWRSRSGLLTLVAWAGFGFVHVEETRSLARSALPPPRPPAPDSDIRVATLNGSTSLEAIDAALKHDPEILLLQESPGQRELETLLAAYPQYTCSFWFDTSILTRGRILEETKKRFYTGARIQVSSRELFVVSLRLATSDPRIDLWNPACWQGQGRMRARQLREMSEIVAILPPDQPTVIGGDFNVPQGDKVFSLLRPRLVDTFAAAGRGWGNTFLSDVPVLRIDQIWTSRHFKATATETRAVPETDHRMYTATIRFVDSP